MNRGLRVASRDTLGSVDDVDAPAEQPVSDGAAANVAPATSSTRTRKPKKVEPQAWHRIDGIISSPMTGGPPHEVTYKWRHYRFLLDDGRTYDVSAIWNDSELAGVVLAATGAEKIAGSVEVPSPEVES